MDKQRFKELYQLAHGGDVVAQADLWLEFEFAYGFDSLPEGLAQSSPEREAPCE